MNEHKTASNDAAVAVASPLKASFSIRKFSSLVADCSSRIICVAALCWFVLVVAQSYGNGDTSQHSSIESVGFSVPSGYWTFHDSDLSFSSECCDEAIVDAALLRLERNTIESSQPNIDVAQLIQLAEANGASKSRCKSGAMWSFDGDEMRFRLVASAGQSPALLALAIAVKQSGHWELFTLGSESRGFSMLLPMGSDAISTCNRLSTDGKVLMQIVSTSESSELITQRWIRNGWKIENTPWRASTDLGLYCKKAGETVYVWEHTTADSRTILLSAME